MIRLLTRLNCSFLDNFFSSVGDIDFWRLWWINEVCFEWLGDQNYGGCRSYMRLRTGCVWFICNTARALNFIMFLCIFHQRSMTLVGLDLKFEANVLLSIFELSWLTVVKRSILMPRICWRIGFLSWLKVWDEYDRIRINGILRVGYRIVRFLSKVQFNLGLELGRMLWLRSLQYLNIGYWIIMNGWFTRFYMIDYLR